MESIGEQKQEKNKIIEVTLFPVPFKLEEIKEDLKVNTITPSQFSKEQIMQKAFKSHSQGNISEAAKNYQDLINQGFIDHRVFSNYGVIMKETGKLEEAEVLMRKAIELKPNFADAFSNLGTILTDLGKLEEAEVSMRKAIELKPDFADAFSNLGTILADLGKLEEAELFTRKAIEYKPEFAKLHYNLGNIMRNLGKLEEAEVSMRKAIELKPNFAKAFYSLAHISRNLNKLETSILNFEKAIEFKMDYSLCQVGIGKVLLQKGNFVEGLREMKEGQGSIQFNLEKGFSII
jgi:tetratricopeptide (TPR) repeat protein